MSSIIRILSDHVINQIAAGEVIENPASVVKELVENAIDAGAKEIIIEERGGGLQFIRVIDDGGGMSPDDALLCLERHATSKLKGAEDLFTLQTMGFRGEALASIAAVSKLVLTTSKNGLATQIVCEEGRILKKNPASRNKGTTVEVRSLFSHLPGRKKFQKSPSLCSLDILKVVTQLSLAHPAIRFELIREDRISLVNDGSAVLKKRMEEVLGPLFLKNSFEISFEEAELKIRGILGSPFQSRTNRSGQYLFINQRAVSCLPLSYAIRDGYGMRIEKQKHPVFCLHLELPPDLIDVNVHPQKLQVRLRKEEEIREKIRKAVNLALNREEELPAYTNQPHEKKPEPRPDWSATPVFSDSSFSIKDDPPLFIFKEEELFSEKEELDACTPIGVFRHFLLLDGERMHFDGIIAIDLHAAEMRILYDHLSRKEEAIESQALLIPELFTFSGQACAQLLENIPQLEALGFGIRALSSKNFVVDALPPFLEPSSISELLEEVSLVKERQEEILKRILRYRKKKCYSLPEGLAIGKSLMKSSSPSLCPFGKSVILYLSSNEIEKLSKQT